MSFYARPRAYNKWQCRPVARSLNWAIYTPVSFKALNLEFMQVYLVLWILLFDLAVFFFHINLFFLLLNA